MKTIGAKELRLHLDQILDRVLGGEEIVVNHRFKGPVKLSALHTTSTVKPERLAGLRKFDSAPKRKATFDNKKTIKELYIESLTKKYGQ
jgi:antitoxin (DNA-binding transcriptional repressor) of toxin-antitoxin stability system